uniref:Uncharacterized protein n=1 Tax=Cucumis melo TaxID=3656 RepID=A0A9I9ECH3_CUCME
MLASSRDTVTECFCSLNSTVKVIRRRNGHQKKWADSISRGKRVCERRRLKE